MMNILKKFFHKKKESQFNVYNFLQKNEVISDINFENFIGVNEPTINGTNIINSQFNNGEFLSTKFSFCKINNSYFNNIIFNCGSFYHTKFYKTTFKNVHFTDNLFISTIFDSCTFINCSGNFSFISSIDGLFENCIFKNSFQMKCPEKGAYIAYKQIYVNNSFYGEQTSLSYAIAKLLIPSDAKRSSAFGNKCRADKAIVLEIYDMSNNTITYDIGYSFYDPNFIYKVGETVRVKNFDTNRWNECTSGIHHFMTLEEAMQY